MPSCRASVTPQSLGNESFFEELRVKAAISAELFILDFLRNRFLWIGGKSVCMHTVADGKFVKCLSARLAKDLW